MNIIPSQNTTSTPNSIEQKCNLSSRDIQTMIFCISQFLSQYLSVTKNIPSHCNDVSEYFKYLICNQPQGIDPKGLPFSRITVKQLECDLVTAVAHKYLNNQCKIVEIGAGELDRYGLSYFMQRIPASFRQHVEPTEFNRCFFDANAAKGSLKELDCIELSQHYPLQSVDCIIGSCVLDVLSNGDLAKTLAQAHEVLKAGEDYFISLFWSLIRIRLHRTIAVMKTLLYFLGVEE